MENNIEISQPKLQQGIGANAVLSLVFGILSYFICFFIFGIVSWILGSIELNRIKRGVSSDSGKAIASIGMWLGIINVIISVGVIIFLIIVTLVFPALLMLILNEFSKIPANHNDTIEIIFKMLTF
jgi:hypothetical protein